AREAAGNPAPPARDDGGDRQPAAGPSDPDRRTGLQSARGEARAARAAEPADREICLADDLGVAGGTREGNEAELRPRDGAVSVRAGRAREARRSALHLCRASAAGAARRAAPLG